MRFLRTDTNELELVSFFGGEIPEYAILSHRWEREEVTYEDLRGGKPDEDELRKLKYKSYAKVKGCRDMARQHQYQYVWIDSCCIDRSDSVELSESINSMFNLYHKASICYAYLSDVEEYSSLARSQWFTRGWTLQELIAPARVTFYNNQWVELGTKTELLHKIESITGIPRAVLHHFPNDKRLHCRFCNPTVQGFLRLAGSGIVPCSHHNYQDHSLVKALEGCSIASRLSWVSRRRTTKPEDLAYCLLGIFNVSMPLLYGEGTRAFVRLQQEILKNSDDQSILAFARRGPEWPFDGQDSLLAESPLLFADSYNLLPSAAPGSVLITPTSKTIETNILLCPLKLSDNPKPESGQVPYWLGILQCTDGSDTLMHPALVLEAVSESRSIFRRVHSYVLVNIQLGGSYHVTLGRGRFDLVKYVYDINDVRPKKINLLLVSRTPNMIPTLPSTPKDPTLLVSTSEVSYKILYAFPNEPVACGNGLYAAASKVSSAKKVHESYELWGLLCFGVGGSVEPLCVLWGVEKGSVPTLQPWCKVVGWARVLQVIFPTSRGTVDTFGQMFRVVAEDEIWKHPSHWVSLANLPVGLVRAGESQKDSRDGEHKAGIRLEQFLGQYPVLHLTMSYRHHRIA